MIVAIDTNCILPGQVGGIENYTLGLIEALKLPASGASKLLLLTRAENHSLFAGFADEQTEVLQVRRPSANWAESSITALAEFQRRKADLLIRHGVDLIHFPGNTINPLDLNLPIVLNLHDLQHRHFPEYFSAEEIAQREKWWAASARRADALVAASNFVRDDLVGQLSLDREKIFVTPDAFQSTFFNHPTAAQLADLRRKFELPQTFFIYPAAAWPHKNHRRLIQAFLTAGITGSQLVLTGNGQDGIPPAQNVRLLGRISTEDLAGLYHLATALIFPSEFEAWSIPIMEAMACGCPVASSNVTSLPEQVGNAGLLFDPTDTSAMASTMRRLASDRELRQRLGDRGRQRITRFAPEHFLQSIVKTYEFAISTHQAKRAA
ncbi:MAG TPA: glycosyltransferase family 1 protein [Tepidisphaeraceae bacterium]|jgi:glycosyltransferase involved in cell wall biosynthesis|nr:glycosyltransferase family 1 protein [Tepidisphaeraceae bacterium]